MIIASRSTWAKNMRLKKRYPVVVVFGRYT